MQASLNVECRDWVLVWGKKHHHNLELTYLIKQFGLSINESVEGTSLDKFGLDQLELHIGNIKNFKVVGID